MLFAVALNIGVKDSSQQHLLNSYCQILSQHRESELSPQCPSNSLCLEKSKLPVLLEGHEPVFEQVFEASETRLVAEVEIIYNNVGVGKMVGNASLFSVLEKLSEYIF